jgi:hypothetical protein
MAHRGALWITLMPASSSGGYGFGRAVMGHDAA